MSATNAAISTSPPTSSPTAISAKSLPVSAGKLTFTPDGANTIDLSASRREETDIQGFGNQVAFEADVEPRDDPVRQGLAHVLGGEQRERYG